MKKVLALSLALILLLGITSHGTFGLFSDTETSAGNTFTAWVDECEPPCCGEHCFTFLEHDGLTWTYRVTSGTSPALGHWVMEWSCCGTVEEIYENGELITEWECGCFWQEDQPNMCGIKFDKPYGDGEMRLVTIVLNENCTYTEGCVRIGTKAAQDIYYCEVWGPICDCCDSGSIIIVSDTDTMVTEVNNAPITPQPAVLAWQPYDPDNDHWNTSITYNGTPYTFPDDADWIWETVRTDDPGENAQVLGRVVRFEMSFYIPCSPRGATLHMTVDNGYTVWINSHLVGSAQVNTGWETSDLTEDYVHTSDWMTVEHYTIDSTDLVTGENVLVILAANEYYDTDDGHGSLGTWESNPAGLIYWLEVEWGD